MKQTTKPTVWLHSPGRAVFRLMVAAALALTLPGMLEAQTLLHRYSFATDGTDSVGGANGTLVAPNGGPAATISSGLNLPGNTGGGYGVSGYLSLPSGILTNTASLTIECWATQNSQNTWAELWDFGNNGSQNFGLIPYPANNGNHMEVAFTPHGGEHDLQTTITFPSSVEQYVSLTYNSSSLVANIYTNAVLEATTTMPDATYTPGTIGGATGTIENSLGNDVYGDEQFNGTVYEFRIWNGVVSQRYLSASAIAGPSVLITNLNPSSATLTAGSNIVLTGTEVAQLYVELPQTGTNLLYATTDATNWTSSNPNILTVNSNGLISAVGLGTATVSAKIANMTATSGNITVTPQVLQHRYSFVSDASDSVGGANGTVVPGSAAPTISNGLTLPGTGTSGNPSGYVSLPNGILQGDTSVTVECWVTENVQQTWAEIWSFGISGGSENFGLIPASPVPNMRVAFTPSGNGERDITASSAMPTNSEQYLAVTYNNTVLTGRLYTNGTLFASTVMPNTFYSPGNFGNTPEDVIGSDPFGGDAQFNGTVYEFRIWNGAVSPLYVAVSAVAGPSVVVTNLTPNSLTMNVTNTSMVGAQTQQATITGNFSAASGVNVTGAATNWSSSNPSILTVSSSGLITAQSGGSATVSAVVGGVTATSASISVQSTVPVITQQPSPVTTVIGETATFTVQALGGSLNYQWSKNSSPIPGATLNTLVLSNVTFSQQGSYSVLVTNTLGSTNSISVALNVQSAILQHRYSFVSDASDSVGTANGTLVAGSNPATIANGLFLPGTGTSGTPSGYVSLPNGMLQGDTSISVECWAMQNAPNTWAEIWSFGVNGGSQNFGLIPASPVPNMRVAFTPPGNGEVDILANAAMPSGVEEYLAVTFDNSDLTGSLYTNGVLYANVVLPNSNYSPGNYGNSTDDTIGSDPYGGDAQFNGTVYELRIWNGVLSPLQLAVDSAAGPGSLVTNLTPQSVSVTVTNSSLVGGETEPADVTATFQGVTGSVDVTGAATNWTSGNTNILVVNNTGVVTAIGAGSTTISATVNGTTGTSASITVQATPPIITQEPAASAELIVGGTLHASVANVGAAPFAYRWYFNSSPTPIAGQNSSTLVLGNVQAGNAGNYTCVISNAFGTTNSTPLALTVITPSTYQSDVLALAPVAFWPLNEPIGAPTAYDIVGGYNGAYNGNLTAGYPGPTNAEFGSTVTNDSVFFSGGYVDIPGSPFNITGAITVSAWVQMNGTSGFGDIVGHGDQSWRLTVNGANPGANDGSTPNDANSLSGIADGNWHNLTYTYDGSLSGANGLLYVDGALKANNEIAAVPAGDNLDVWIGGAPDYPGARMYSGFIADVSVFDKALSAAQVAGLYNGSVTLSIKSVGSTVVLTWPSGVLLQAPTPKGPWTPNNSATSPYTVNASGGMQFFKVQVSP